MWRTQRTDKKPSYAWHPNRVFLGVTLALSAVSAGVLWLGSQLSVPKGLRQLTPEDAARLYQITIQADPDVDPPWLARRVPTGRAHGDIGQKIGKATSPRPRQPGSPKLQIRSLAPSATQALRQSAGVLGLIKSTQSGLLAVRSASTALGSDAADALGTLGIDHAQLAGPNEEPLPAPSITDHGSTGPDTSHYQHHSEHGINQVAESPVSTFSLDVDTGSYSNVRGYIRRGTLPPGDAVRLEELINYFPYDYAEPSGPHPFSVSTETARCPWNPDHVLLRIGVQAKREDSGVMPPANLVFLVDVSGSMHSDDKLPLLQQSLRTLVAGLRPQDRVSIVTYAGYESIALNPTPGSQRSKILAAIDQLSAGGSTAGEAGIRTAYELAKRSFLREGINRVILATDGDFNVGVSDVEQLKSLVSEQRKSGVFLSTLGFGSGNYNDALMEQIADVGNGNYSYIDSLREGKKVLRDQLATTLHTVAKDVKVQVEFQPSRISEYRLLGYENRTLTRADFKNDAVDAGEIGAGTSVTALYELTPIGSPSAVEPLRYLQRPTRPVVLTAPTQPSHPDELAFVRVRYQAPEGGSSRELQHEVPAAGAAVAFARASDDFRFAAAVAGFGQIVRGGTHTQAFTLAQVAAIADRARGQDALGYRREFVGLVHTTRHLMND